MTNMRYDKGFASNERALATEAEKFLVHGLETLNAANTSKGTGYGDSLTNLALANLKAAEILNSWKLPNR